MLSTCVYCKVNIPAYKVFCCDSPKCNAQRLDDHFSEPTYTGYDYEVEDSGEDFYESNDDEQNYCEEE